MALSREILTTLNNTQRATGATFQCNSGGRPIHLRCGSSDSLVFKEIFLDRCYAAAARCLPANAVVVDLGANIGLATIYFLQHAPGSQFFCVEPNHDNIEIIRRNLGAVPGVTIIEAALWDRSAWIRLTLANTTSKLTQWAYRCEECDESAPGAIQAISVNELISKIAAPKIDLIKMDIEGSETVVLPALADHLPRVGALCIEFHGKSRKTSQFDALMAEHGFEIVADENEGYHDIVLAINRAVLPAFHL